VFVLSLYPSFLAAQTGQSYSKWFSVTTPSLKENAVGMTWNCGSRNKTFRRGTDGEREDAFVPGPCVGDSVPPEMGPSDGLGALELVCVFE
jgi:hypothetical protein